VSLKLFKLLFQYVLNSFSYVVQFEMFRKLKAVICIHSFRTMNSIMVIVT